MNPALPTYCLFSPVVDADVPADGRRNTYRVEAVNAVIGELPAVLDTLPELTRLENNSVIAPGTALCLRGVTQHYQYTSAAQREGLAHSRGEFAAGADVQAVLIPIRKSPAWWNLPTDRRQVFFDQRPAHAGHTAIGGSYADRVFRKLYHSRYLDPALGYDFLTYFEFRKADAPSFDELLTKLRDPVVNPEWAYVDLEYEIRMTKIS